MKISEICKKVAFKEIFKSYNLPSVTGLKKSLEQPEDETAEPKYDEFLKTYEEWINDFNSEVLGYSYSRGEFNVLRDNSFNEVFDFFSDELKAFYKERVLDKIEKNPSLGLAPESDNEEEKSSEEPVVKINVPVGN